MCVCEREREIKKEQGKRMMVKYMSFLSQDWVAAHWHTDTYKLLCTNHFVGRMNGMRFPLWPPRGESANGTIAVAGINMTPPAWSLFTWPYRYLKCTLCTYYDTYLSHLPHVWETLHLAQQSEFWKVSAWCG